MQVIAATNRADILDPALMRSGRLDRKIEFPHPTEEARARILQVWYLQTLSADIFFLTEHLLTAFLLILLIDPFSKDECSPRCQL